MLPNATLTAMADNLARLHLDPLTHLKVTVAVFAPLLANEKPSGEVRPTVFRELSGEVGPNVSNKLTTPAVARSRSKRKGRRPHKKYDKRRRHDQPTPSEVAVAFLEQQLASGPKPASDVESLALKRGIQAEALDRAKSALHVVASRMNAGHGNTVHLQLPA